MPPLAQPSILSRLSGLVPDYKPFATPGGGTPVRRRPPPAGDEKLPTRSTSAMDRIWFLPYADDTATDDSPEVREAMRDMIRDPYVKTAWLTQVLSVLAQPFQVQTPKKLRKNAEAQEQADFIRHCLEHCEGGQGGMLGIGNAILMNLGSDGFSLAEKVWAVAHRGKYANRTVLRALKPKDVEEHGRLIGDRFNNVVGVWSNMATKTFPITDFVYCRYLHRFDEPFGMAAFRASYGAHWSRDTVRKLRIIHKEKMLDGLLMGYYTDPADKPTLETALARARSSTWLTIPEGVRVEQLAKSQASESDYKSMDESLKEETIVGIALAHLHILQGGVSDARGNTAVHKSVADLGPWLLAYIVQYALNRQVIPDLIDYNYPFTSEYPTVSLGGLENAEILEMLQVLDGAQRAGFNPSRNYYATELTIQEADPTDPTDALAPPQPAMGGFGGPGGLPPGPGGSAPPGPAGGILPTEPADPAAPPGNEFGGFADRNPYTVFGWEDWKQIQGGKWASASGKRVLSDAVYRRLSGRAAAKQQQGPATVRAPQRPQLEGGTAGHKPATPTAGQQGERLVRMLSGSIKRTPAELQDAAAGIEKWPNEVLAQVHHALFGGPTVEHPVTGRSVPKPVSKGKAIAAIREKIGGGSGTAAPPAQAPTPTPTPKPPPAYNPRQGYTLTNRELARMRGRLAGAIKSGNAGNLATVLRSAKETFDQKGYPDDWSRWQRAADDARIGVDFDSPPGEKPKPATPTTAQSDAFRKGVLAEAAKEPKAAPFRPLEASGVKLPNVSVSSLYSMAKKSSTRFGGVVDMAADDGIWTDVKAMFTLAPDEQAKFKAMRDKSGEEKGYRKPPVAAVLDSAKAKTGNSPPAKVLGFRPPTDDNGKTPQVLLEHPDGTRQVIDAKYYAMVTKRFPAAEFRLAGKGKGREWNAAAIGVWDKGNLVGVVMPMGEVDEERYEVQAFSEFGITYGRHGTIDVFGWDDWDARGQHMVSPGGRVLRRETWERLKAASPRSDAASAAGSPPGEAAAQPPAAKRTISPDRHIQARLERIRGNKQATLAETEGDVRAAAVELGGNPPQPQDVIDLVKAGTPGLEPQVQTELGQRLASAASAGSPEGVKSGWRSLAEWAAGLPLKAATGAVRGLLWLAKRLLLNTSAALVPPLGGVWEKLKRSAPSMLKYVGVLALNAGLFAASIAVPVLLPIAIPLKLAIAVGTTAAAAGWLTVGFGAKRMLRKAGQEVMTNWTGDNYVFDQMRANPVTGPGAGRQYRRYGEGENGEDLLALAGKDGRRATELMTRSMDQGKQVLGRMTEQAVGRLLTDPDPLGATVLFSDDELQQVAASLSATTAAADLLGRSRVRRLAHHAKQRAEKFAEGNDPVCPTCHKRGTWVRTDGSANADCVTCGKFTAPLPPEFTGERDARTGKAKFNEMMGYPEQGVPPATSDADPFDVFAEAPDAMPANLAAEYFRGLVPDLGIDPGRYAPSLDRHAFTLSVAADQALLGRVKQIILDQVEAGRRPFAVADIQDELDAAGVSTSNPQYAEMVYRTNMNDAYMQGFSREMGDPEMQQEFPAWQYLGIRDGRQGEDHEPHFDRYYPNTATFGEVRGSRVFNCRCSAAPIHRVEWDDLKRRGVRTEGGW